MTTWREQLDQRISRCSGCDELIWDGRCPRCDRRNAGFRTTNVPEMPTLIRQPKSYTAVTKRMIDEDPADLDLGGPTTDRATHQPATDRRRGHIMPYFIGSIDPCPVEVAS